jgi:hypothetical protein
MAKVRGKGSACGSPLEADVAEPLAGAGLAAPTVLPAPTASFLMAAEPF